ncbi:MAG: hypothetical protein HY787_18080 [Deltaproteobacteria bacterium]|nr:hypothetical protein [Deltaproteobacteria bacterium]
MSVLPKCPFPVLHRWSYDLRFSTLLTNPGRIDHPRKLIEKDPFKLYKKLGDISGQRIDPCVIDVFMSAVHFMEGGDPLPWWSFKKDRKKRTTKLQ